jgi:hypothetical protein
MKATSFLLTTIALGTIAISTVPFQSFAPNSLQASAQEVKPKPPKQRSTKLQRLKVNLVVEIYSANYIPKISIPLACNQVARAW